MTYYADGTLMRRSTLLEWCKNRRDTFGLSSPLFQARRQKSWRTFGWLEPGHDYATGACPPGLLRTLQEAGDHPVDQTRGRYSCRFCPSSHDELRPLPKLTTASGRELLLGSASLEVLDTTGQAWIAPDLVLHYVVEHRYLPPAELADARLAPR